MKNKFLLLMSLVIVASCQVFYPEAKPMPDITMDHMKKIDLNVENISFIDLSNNEKINNEKDSVVATSDYDLSGKYKNILSSYINNRYKAVSTNNKAVQVILKEFNIDKSYVKSKNKWKNYMGLDKKERVKVNVKLWIRGINEYGDEYVANEVVIKRYASFDASVSISKREYEMFWLLDNLLKDTDQAVLNSLINPLQVTFPDHDNKFLRSSL